MAVARDQTRKPHEQPNFYIAFSDRLAGSLHVEVGLHFRNVKKIDNFSEKAIDSLYHHRSAFTNLIETNEELKDLELFLASGKKYKRIENFKVSDLDEKNIIRLEGAYGKHRDVRVIFARIYNPKEVIALKDRFSEKIMETFETLHKIFDFLKVS